MMVGGPPCPARPGRPPLRHLGRWRDYLGETLGICGAILFGVLLATVIIMAFTHPDGTPLGPHSPRQATTVELPLPR